MTAVQAGFPAVFREWRQFRKLSQLDLALAADVSQRHVSWLETGRSQPSRAMVVRLAEALEVPLRQRNVLLQAAGFAPGYNETELEAPQMEPVAEALRLILEHHEPFPAVVVDRYWNVRLKNKAADLLLGVSGAADELQAAADGQLNLALLTLHPAGIRPFISNWEEASHSFMQRLRSEAMATLDPGLRERFDEYMALVGPVTEPPAVTAGLLPVLPLELNIDGLELSLFSVISTFGTPQDVTTDELRIETFYPSDAATDAFFRSLPGG